jgi:hypothetical protein
MTNKVYKTAQGQTVDIGALILQNENVRAVGNMNVNARGDLLDGNNKVIDQKNRQVQRQYKRQVQSIAVPPAKQPTNTVEAKRMRAEQQNEQQKQETLKGLDTDPLVEAPAVVAEAIPETGLAAAISRARKTQPE